MLTLEVLPGELGDVCELVLDDHQVAQFCLAAARLVLELLDDPLEGNLHRTVSTSLMALPSFFKQASSLSLRILSSPSSLSVYSAVFPP